MAAEKLACREQLAEDQVLLQGSISEIALEMKDVVTMTDLDDVHDNCQQVISHESGTAFRLCKFGVCDVKGQ